MLFQMASSNRGMTPGSKDAMRAWSSDEKGHGTCSSHGSGAIPSIWSTVNPNKFASSRKRLAGTPRVFQFVTACALIPSFCASQD